MSVINRPAIRDVYRRLRKGFKQFSQMWNVHLDDALLHEMGVDPLQIDLEEETERGGPYFLPMSQECINKLDRRLGFCIEYDDPMNSPVEAFDDGQIVDFAFRNQLLLNNDESSWAAYQSSHWQEQ